ncbi:unnamed protein product [Closterium sp. Yama58-4]|nr:unnamed protein product [Closterium sp. Yama58-4]
MMVDGTKLPIHGGSTLQLQIAQLKAAANEEKPISELHAAVQGVLAEYKDIMPDDLLTGVPPARTHEHEIVEEPVMLFGLCIAQKTFQEECVVVHLDNILIYSKNLKEHVKHLRKVFENLQENKFYVKMSKNDFVLKKVQFVGHMVSAEGVQCRGHLQGSLGAWYKTSPYPWLAVQTVDQIKLRTS